MQPDILNPVAVSLQGSSLFLSTLIEKLPQQVKKLHMDLNVFFPAFERLKTSFWNQNIAQHTVRRMLTLPVK